MARAKTPQDKAPNVLPDRIKLSAIQSQRLSSLTNVGLDEIKGRTIAELSESLKWRIDPDCFLFRRICGQVVRWDPISGQYQPVPFATVHVVDTDCDFLGLMVFCNRPRLNSFFRQPLASKRPGQGVKTLCHSWCVTGNPGIGKPGRCSWCFFICIGGTFSSRTSMGTVGRRSR